MKARRSYFVSDIMQRAKVEGWVRTNPYRRKRTPARDRCAHLTGRLPHHSRRAMLDTKTVGRDRRLMKIAELFTTNLQQSPRVRDDEIDLFGLTHPGKVRLENEDHFLAA